MLTGALQRPRSLVLICFLCLLSFSANTLSKPTCLSRDLSAVNGLVPGDNANSFLVQQDLLSTLLQKVDRSVEDDGGEYIESTYHFQGLDVILARSTVYAIRLNEQGLMWANGVSVGDPVSRVKALIPIKPVVANLDYLSYLVCSDADDVYAVLPFKGGKLQHIELMVDWP